jgi:hypothetical protein
MSATILQFPERIPPQPGLMIPLYTKEEVDATLASINVYSRQPYRINEEDLQYLDAQTVWQCLMLGRLSTIFSTSTKNTIRRILANTESVQKT